MVISFDDAFEANENGIAVTNPDGSSKLYIVSGSGSPQGSPAPVNSWYFQEDQPKLWRKDGAGDNDWVEFVAKVAESIELEAYSDNAVSSTTSNGWVTKFTATTTLKEAGNYLLLHSGQVTNSQNNKETGYRVQWKPDDSGTWITLVEDIFLFARGESYLPVTAVNIVELLSSDQIDIRFQFGETDGGGTGRLKNVSLTVIKVEL